MTKELLHTIILNNSVQSWLIVIAIILFMLLFSKALSKLLAFISVKYFTKVAQKKFQETISLRLVKPLSRYLFWGVSIMAVTKLNYPEILQFKIIKLRDILIGLSAGWLTICFFQLVIGIMLLVSAVLQNKASRHGDRSMLQLIALLTDLFRVVLIVICIIAIVKFSLKYSMGSFVTSLGLVTAALALAAKESVENVICCIIIFLDKPFITGDSIKIGDVSGVVEKIGLRSTLLRTDNKTIESIPNRQMAGSMLENTSNQSQRRFAQTLELSLQTNSASLRSCINDILEIVQHQHEGQISNITVFLKETGANSHKVYMEYYMPMSITLAEFRSINQAIILEIIDLLDKQQIELVKYFPKTS